MMLGKQTSDEVFYRRNAGAETQIHTPIEKNSQLVLCIEDHFFDALMARLRLPQPLP